MGSGYSDGSIGIYKVMNLEKSMTLGDSAIGEEKLPVGSLRYPLLLF